MVSTPGRGGCVSERMTERAKDPGAEGPAQAIDSVRWNVIACQVWGDITDMTDPDVELMAAIEAFRQRQLAMIDAQLAEFGIEPPAQKTEKPEPSYFMMILGEDEREKRCATS
jgi:hypothetical protein